MASCYRTASLRQPNNSVHAQLTMTAALVPSEEAAEQPNTVDYSICTIVFSAEQMNFYLSFLSRN
jgi:hypothetical protein